MGVPHLLPEKIPLSNDDIESVTRFGIVIDKESGYVLSNHTFYSYKLPKGWRMVKRTRRPDLPIFYIINEDRKVIVTIMGTWKGIYDNALTTSIFKEPFSTHINKEDYDISSNDSNTNDSSSDDDSANDDNNNNDNVTKFKQLKADYEIFEKKSILCGKSGQYVLDMQYTLLCEVFNKLTDDERVNNGLTYPDRKIVDDDRMHGFLEMLSTMNK